VLKIYKNGKNMINIKYIIDTRNML